MSILFRYFMKIYLGNFLRVIIGLLLVVILIDMVELSRRTAAVIDVSLLDTAFLAALRAPSFLQNTVAFVALFATMLTLLALNKRHELVITRASGLSAWQFIAPICVGSFMIGVIAVTVFNPLAAATLVRATSQEITLGLTAPSGTNSVPWFRQVGEDGIVIIGAEQTSNGGMFLGRPSFYFFDANNNFVERVDAETASLVDGNWVLNKTRVFKNDAEIQQLEQFITPASVDAGLLGQALTPPDTVAFFDLGKSMDSARAFGLSDSPYAMRWHSLVALPALLVAMTLIAATVSLRFARFGHSSTAILGGILAGFLLYVVSAMAEALGGAGVIAPVISAWLPVIAASFFGVTFLLHREDG
jgi:lipopolysaccharide export system permease protein